MKLYRALRDMSYIGKLVGLSFLAVFVCSTFVLMKWEPFVDVASQEVGRNRELELNIEKVLVHRAVSQHATGPRRFEKPLFIELAKPSANKTANP